jgi:hypothetical protein
MTQICLRAPARPSFALARGAVHLSRRTLLTGWLALFGAMGCHKELALVTIEGELAPELDLRGEIYFSAFRQVFFCRRNLLQAPTQKDKTVHAKFVRTGNHYTLTYDSSDTPRGGICDWRPDGIVVDADFRSQDTGDMAILKLLPIGAAKPSTQDGRRVEKATHVTCDIDYASRPPDLDCDLFNRVLEDRSEAVHLTLNVAYEKGHTPVRN